MKTINTGLCVVLLMSFPLFFFWGPDYHAPRSLKAAWNLGHILFFALAIFVLLHSRLLKNCSFWHQLQVTLGVSLLAGVLIEGLQSRLGRDADIADIYRNCLGALLIMSWSSSAKRSLRGARLLTLRGLSAVLLLHQLSFPVLALLNERRSTQLFPVLTDFESPWQLQRWRAGKQVVLTRSSQQVYEGSHSLWIQLSTRRFSGIFLKKFPRDWRAYQSLRFELYNPAAEPLFITVRIHDRQHRRGEQLFSDRFNQRYPLQQGWNSIVIDLQTVQQAPATRAMDLSAIESVGLFVVNEKTAKQLYLDYVRLQ